MFIYKYSITPLKVNIAQRVSALVCALPVLLVYI